MTNEEKKLFSWTTYLVILIPGALWRGYWYARLWNYNDFLRGIVRMDAVLFVAISVILSALLRKSEPQKDDWFSDFISETIILPPIAYWPFRLAAYIYTVIQ